MTKSRLLELSNRTFSERIFKVTLLVVSAIMLAWAIVGNRWDTDSTWMIAQGREILENGIPYTDTFCILPDMNFVAQGWLFYVVVAIFDSIGEIGSLLFTIIIVGLSFTAGYLYLSQYNIKAEYKVFSVASLIIVIGYAMAPRPNAITIVLLVFECIAFERYKKTRKWQWLLILPAGMLLETNFHCSMIWIHFLIALAYICPSVIHSKYRTYNRHCLMPILFSLLMIPCMFVNPYGLDAVLYLPRSLLCDTFSIISVSEMQTSYTRLVFVAIVAVGMSIPLYWKKSRRLYSHQVYLFLGFFILLIFASRNIAFMFPALLTIIAPFLRHLTLCGIKMRVYSIILFVAISLFFGIKIAIDIPEIINDDFSMPAETIATELGYNKEMINADTYMRENGDVTELNLFAGFNEGGYFEYLGYTNVYMDARPENRMKALNGQRDELVEFVHYCVTGVDEGEEESKHNEDVKNWIDEYDFNYIYITKDCEVALYEYMNTVDTEYSTVFDTEDGALYEKK